MPRPLILASTSPYRRELLSRLGIPFETRSPRTDETEAVHEPPRATALRLAEDKARAVAKSFPEAVVIGADQIAEVNGIRLNKPGEHAQAVRQLRQMSGQRVLFHSALAVVCLAGQGCAKDVVPVTVHMRILDDAQIERYLLTEKPYDCAGSAKVEGMGITLVHAIDSNDPTAVIGLPLIRLSEMLRGFGYELP
ncbi:MAG: septum formation protein Maf [Betaproteobacteria bacterium]|nr:septum formation protein Maf [Betaproteobacteria bacterium]